MVIDVTGLASVDSLVLRTLLATLRSAEMLGAQPIGVGISPEIAEILEHLGMPLDNLLIMADLRAAVGYALQQAPLQHRKLAQF